MIVTFVLSIVIGSVLVYVQSEKDYETKVLIVDEQTDKYVEVYEIVTFPSLHRKYSEEVTGKGMAIFETELYSPVMVTVKAPGYKTKRVLKVWNATEDNAILLEELETQEKEEVQKPKEKEEPNKTKVDLLPNFKKE